MSTDKTSIFINEEEIPFVRNDKDIFLNKLCMIYGPSGSGKTQIILHLLHLLKDHIPNAIVANPTNQMNNTYTNIFPEPCIYTDVTKECLDGIYKRQEATVTMYKKVNNINNLNKIFMKCASIDEQNKLNSFNKSYQDTKKSIELSKDFHITEKSAKITNLEQKHNTVILTFLKKIISIYKVKLETSGRMSPLELSIINCLYINPNLLILFDDTGHDIKNWQAYKETRTLFFNARHYCITTIITLQDDKILDSALRKNVHINFFTEAQTAIAFFTRSANNFSKKQQKKIEGIIEELFKENPGSKYKNYKKLCYFGALNQQTKKIQYIIANIYDKFRFGSDSYWQFCQQVQKKVDDDIQKSDMFSKLFLDDNN